MVQISSKGYNVAKVGINGILEQDTDTIIGTAVDFDTIARFAKTGYMVLRCKYKEGAETLMFDGSVDCEINEDGTIFISTLTDNDAENDEDKKFYAITGVIYKSEGKCYMNLSEDEISGGGGSDGEYIEVTADGVKTYGQLIAELSAMIDTRKMTRHAYFVIENISGTFILTDAPNKNAVFSSCSANLAHNGFGISTVGCSPSPRDAYYVVVLYNITQGTCALTDKTSNVPTNGTKLTIYF